MNNQFIQTQFTEIQKSDITSIPQLKKAAYITSAYCASINQLNKYGAYMQMLETNNTFPSIKKKAKRLEVYLLSIAEKAVEDFNQGKYNPPILNVKGFKGFQK